MNISVPSCLIKIVSSGNNLTVLDFKTKSTGLHNGCRVAPLIILKTSLMGLPIDRFFDQPDIFSAEIFM